MAILLVQKIDGYGGDVIPGEPVDGDLVRITYPNGTIVEKIYRPAPEVVEPTRVYVHILLAGGDGGNPTGIESDGVDSLDINIILRNTVLPDSPIKTGINRTWFLKFRNGDGFIYDYLKVVFVEGQATIAYTSTKPDNVFIRAEDVNDVIGGAIVTLATAPVFNVYRTISEQS